MPPALSALRARGLKVGLLSNTARDLELFAAHHGLEVDALLTSRVHGKTKPHESIFRGVLGLLDVAAAEAVMVGDSLEDDVEGARAVGMRAVLVDREGRYPDAAGPDRGSRGAAGRSRDLTCLYAWLARMGDRRGRACHRRDADAGDVLPRPRGAALRSPRRSPRLLGGGAVVTLIVFIVGSLASLAFLRPIARSHVRLPALSRTGTDALVGRKAIVTRQVDEHGGRVRIGGEEWSARAYLGGQVLAEGMTVDVIQIEGATALVSE